MKAKRKPIRIKHKIREEKRREKCLAVAFAVVILVAVSGFLVNSRLNQTVGPAYEFKAAIVDHLSLTYPNQTFIETATNTLKQVGYSVDYYPGENVTVEFYRTLPTRGYGIIILRVHSAIAKDRGPPLALFTSELYSNARYIYEQLTDHLGCVHHIVGGQEQTYFGIFANFVKSRMNGRFGNTIIVMMGCNGLTYVDMAKAFTEKGAKLYIGWDNAVSASHTDSAITQLLQHFLIEKLTLSEAVQETLNEVGFDPVYNSQLIYHPLEVGDQTVDNIAGIKQ